MENKGFITIATGDEKYYKLANNLLKSYRFTNAHRLPFAILCDRENDFTKDFDEIVIISDPNNSYMDKVELINYVPFHETIFIEADCLIYDDISKLFDCFSDASPFSMFGEMLPLDSMDGWFIKNNAGKYKNSISFIPNFHSGLIYFRKEKMLDIIYQRFLEIKNEYDQYYFKWFGNELIGDDPIFAMTIASLNLKLVNHNRYSREVMRVYNRNGKKFISRIHKKKYDFLDKENVWHNNILISHWGNVQTLQPIYRREVDCLNSVNKKNNSLLIIKAYIICSIRCMSNCGRAIIQLIKEKCAIYGQK